MSSPSRDEYERGVLARLREDPIEKPPGWAREPEGRLSVEEVRYEKPDLPDENRLVVFFRDAERSGCPFGFVHDPVEAVPLLVVEDPEGGGRRVYAGEEVFAGEGTVAERPEGHATVIRANLQELVFARDMGLPDGCEPGVVTWV